MEIDGLVVGSRRNGR